MIISVRSGRHKDTTRRHVDMTMKILLRNVIKKVEEDNLNEVKETLEEIISGVVRKSYRKSVDDGIEYFTDLRDLCLLEDNGLDYVYCPPIPPIRHTVKRTAILLPVNFNIFKKSSGGNNKTNNQTNTRSSIKNESIEYEYVLEPENVGSEWNHWKLNKSNNEEEEGGEENAIKKKKIQSNKDKKWGFGGLAKILKIDNEDEDDEEESEYSYDYSDSDANSFIDSEDEEEYRRRKDIRNKKIQKEEYRKKQLQIKKLIFESEITDPTPGWCTLEKDVTMLQSRVRGHAARSKVRRTVAGLDPPLYEKYFDYESGNQYFICTTSGRVTWERPKLLFQKPQRSDAELIVYVQTEARRRIAKRRTGDLAALAYVRVLVPEKKKEMKKTSKEAGKKDKKNKKHKKNMKKRYSQRFSNEEPPLSGIEELASDGVASSIDAPNKATNGGGGGDGDGVLSNQSSVQEEEDNDEGGKGKEDGEISLRNSDSGRDFSRSSSSSSSNSNMNSTRDLNLNDFSDQLNENNKEINQNSENLDKDKEDDDDDAEYFFYNTKSGFTTYVIPSLLYHREPHELRMVSDLSSLFTSSTTSSSTSSSTASTTTATQGDGRRLFPASSSDSFKFEEDEDGKTPRSNQDMSMGESNGDDDDDVDEKSQGTSSNTSNKEASINASMTSMHSTESVILENTNFAKTKSSNDDDDNDDNEDNEKKNSDNNLSQRSLSLANSDANSEVSSPTSQKTLKKRSSKTHPKNKLLKKKSSKLDKEQRKAEKKKDAATKIQSKWRSWTCQLKIGRLMIKKQLYKREYDESYRRYFYVYIKTDRVSWNKPRVLYGLKEQDYILPISMIKQIKSNVAVGLGRAAAKVILSSKTLKLAGGKKNQKDDDGGDKPEVNLVIRKVVVHEDPVGV